MTSMTYPEKKREYEFKKLDRLLCNSFDNVKYDVRQLNSQIDNLRNQVAELSINSVNTALKDQSELVLAQENAILLLREELETVRKRLHDIETEKAAKPVMAPRKTEEDISALSSITARAVLKGPQSDTAKLVKQASKRASVYDIEEGQVRITKVQFKSPKGKQDLNAEWVEVTGYDVDMTGYTLHDKGRKHVYRFPEGFKIYGPVKISTGKGRDSNTKLFWNSKKSIWNDEHDIATLRNRGGRTVSSVKSETVHDFVVLR